MKQLTKNRLKEHGAAHFLALFVFVALVGVVGFVGYNAWQKQVSNAGGQNTVGSKAQIKAAEKKVASLKGQLTKANTTLKQKQTAQKKALTNFEVYRKSQMQANPTIDKQFKAKWAAGHVYDDLKAALKKQIATAKKGGISAKERKAIKATEKKVATAKAAYAKAAKPADTVRGTWATYKTYAAARKAVTAAQKKVTSLKKDLKKAQNKVKELKRKKPEANTPESRNPCPSGSSVNSTGTACQTSYKATIVKRCAKGYTDIKSGNSWTCKRCNNNECTNATIDTKKDTPVCNGNDQLLGKSTCFHIVKYL